MSTYNMKEFGEMLRLQILRGDWDKGMKREVGGNCLSKLKTYDKVMQKPNSLQFIVLYVLKRNLNEGLLHEWIIVHPETTG